MLDPSGQPRVRWWPVAYALQRLEDKRALAPLLALAKDPHPYTRAFAAKGLGGLKDRRRRSDAARAARERRPALWSSRASARSAGSAIPPAAAALLKLVQATDTNPHVRLEALAALGGMRAPGVSDLLLDSFTDPNPAIRAAALKSAAALDPEQFVTVLSGLDPDPDWSVRAALASALGTLPPDIALPRLNADAERPGSARDSGGARRAGQASRAQRGALFCCERLKADDPAVRAAAATGLGELKPPNGAPALAEAYQFGQRDAAYAARAAALAALVEVRRDGGDPGARRRRWPTRTGRSGFARPRC